MRPIVLVLVCACADRPRASPPPAPSLPPPSAWQVRCFAVLETVVAAARTIEPGIRGVELEQDRDGGVTLSARSLTSDVMPITIIVSPRSTRPPHAWERFNEPANGTEHITWLLTTDGGQADVALDGWELARAQRLEPTLTAGVEPCLIAAVAPQDFRPRCVRAGGTCVGPAAIAASPGAPCGAGMHRVDDVVVPPGSRDHQPACFGIPFGEEACCMHD